MHAVLLVQPHPSCLPTLLTLYEAVQDKELGDGWIFGTLDVAQGAHFDPTFAVPLSAVRCMAFASDPEKLGAMGSRLLELNRQMAGSMPGSRLFEMSVPVAGSAFGHAATEESELLRLVADLRSAMRTWAHQEDGLPGHAVDAFDRASRLLELPESREDC